MTVVEVVGGEEAAAKVGEETGVGGVTIVGSNTGKTETETETETETDTGGTEVAMSRATTRDTSPIIRGHMMTATELHCCLASVDNIYSILSCALLYV